MSWLEVTWVNGETRRWDYEFGAPGELSVNGTVETCPTLVLTCGDMVREAMVSDEVAKDAGRVRSVATHMACWSDEAETVPAVRLYVWGLIRYNDETDDVGLCLLVVDLGGTVQAMIPIEEVVES